MICPFCGQDNADCCEKYEVFKGLPSALQQIALDEHQHQQASMERDTALPAQPKTRGRSKLFKTV